MTPLSDLIAKLEVAHAGSPELGDEVLLACGWKAAPNYDRNNPHPYWISPDGQNVATNRPDPTTSLDAALTLARGNHELLRMLHAAYFACSGGDRKVDLWPSIRAALIAALRAR